MTAKLRPPSPSLPPPQPSQSYICINNKESLKIYKTPWIHFKYSPIHKNLTEIQFTNVLDLKRAIDDH